MVDFFKGLLTALMGFLWNSAYNVWTTVGAWVGIVWSVLAVVVGYYLDVLSWLEDKVTAVGDGISATLSAWGTGFASFGAFGASAFGMANSFFPVAEFLSMMGVYVALWVGLLIYRVVKSWIPTVSG